MTATLALAAAALGGCGARPAFDPDAAYRELTGELVRGELPAAIDGAERARSALAAMPGADPRWRWKFLLLKADALLKQERMEAVAQQLAADPAFPATGDLAIKRDLILSRAHHYLDREPESARELAEARRLAEAGGSALMGEVLRSEALVERDAGHWDGARDKLDASLRRARAQGDRWLETLDLVSLGFVELHTERYDEAALASQQAVAGAEALGARAQAQLALGNLGWAYFSLGDFDRALTQFQQAERGARGMGDVDSEVRWLQDAGLAEFKLGRYQAAQGDDERALAAARTLPAADEVDDIANIEANLALLALEQGDAPAAQAHGDRAGQSAHGSKDVNVAAYATFMQGLVAAGRASAQAAEPLLLRAHDTATDLEIRMSVENGLAKSYRDRGLPRQAEIWFRRSIETFEQRRATVQDEALRLSAFAYGDAIYRDYADFLIAAHRPGEALDVLDRGRARTLEEGLGLASGGAGAEAAGRHGPGGDAQALARRLGAPILFYSLGPRASLLWVITEHTIRALPLPGEPELRARVEDHQRAIQKSADLLQGGADAALGLYEVLVKPAAADIQPGGRVYIVPDGVLHGLNFETLVRAEGSSLRYWIEDATVVTASSLRMLSQPRAGESVATVRDLLLIGDPLRAAREFEPLPHAAEEMRQVRRHFDGARQAVFAGGAAVPAAYTDGAPEHYRYIHFVAHGTASRQSPLDSAVILSPAPARPEVFKLYARDVVRHPLAARLVTISACYGAGLRTYAGEGLVGLAWAFLRAGAHGVIGALWQADDGATPLLMDRLYQDLAAGAAPEAALRAAKLKLLHGASVYRKPLYWGAFQLYVGS